jgi:hypothetical protein
MVESNKATTMKRDSKEEEAKKEAIARINK